MATVQEIQDAIRRLDQTPEQRTYFDDVRANVGPSAEAALQDFIAVITDPIGTAKDTYDLGKGLFSLATGGDAPEEEIARALGEYYVDRYGSLDAVKNSFRTDPVGVGLDFASVLSGAGSSTRAAAGLGKKVSDRVGAEKTSEFLGKLQSSELSEKARNALILSDVGAAAGTAVVKAPSVLGNVSASLLGTVSGASGDSIGRAFNVGRESLPFSERAKTFRQTAAGQGDSAVSPAQFVDDTQQAFQTLKGNISANYRAGRAALPPGPTTPLVGQTTSRTSAPGPISSTGKQMPPVVTVRPSAPPQRNRPFFASQFDELDKVKTERNAAKGEFSDAEGFDSDALQGISLLEQDVVEFSKSPLSDRDAAFALRQKLDTYNFTEGTQEFRVRNQLRADLSKQLKKDPKYKKLVEDYDEANRLAEEIKSELGLGRTKNVSQSLRKLQSVSRNNVNTNFGRRSDLLAELNPNMNYDPLDVAAALSLQSAEPVGGARIGQAGAQTGGILASGQEGVSLGNTAVAALTAAGFTPRNVGRGAFVAGRGALAASPVTTPIAGILPQATNVAFAQERADVGTDDPEMDALIRRLEAINALK